MWGAPHVSLSRHGPLCGAVAALHSPRLQDGKLSKIAGKGNGCGIYGENKAEEATK